MRRLDPNRYRFAWARAFNEIVLVTRSLADAWCTLRTGKRWHLASAELLCYTSARNPKRIITDPSRRNQLLFPTIIRSPETAGHYGRSREYFHRVRVQFVANGSAEIKLTTRGVIAMVTMGLWFELDLKLMRHLLFLGFRFGDMQVLNFN